MALLHPRLPAADHAALVARVAASPVDPDTLAVVFTSGSTGRAKGVVISRAAAVAAATASAAHLGWTDDDRWLLAVPLAHVAGLAIVVRCLLARRPVVLVPGPFDPDRVVAAVADHRVTLASLVPTQLAALLDRGWRPPPSLRAVLLGGAAASPALLARARAAGVPVLATYGMTETFGQVATARPDGPADVPPDAPADDDRDRLMPLPGLTVTAGTRAAPAPITVAGPTLMTGYLDDPTPPLTRGLVTADLGFVEDGALHVIGRADDVIITGGENVHPAAVEAALAAVPGVAALCAFGLPDPRWGEIVAVAVVPGPGFDRARLDHAAAALAPHARPRHITVVDTLPRTPSGKLDRRAAARAG